MSMSLELATRSPLPPSSSSEINVSSSQFTNQAGDAARAPTATSTTDVDAEAESIALSRISATSGIEHDRNISSLAPVDGGIQAWSFVRAISLRRCSEKLFNTLCSLSFPVGRRVRNRDFCLGSSEFVRCFLDKLSSRPGILLPTTCTYDPASYRHAFFGYYAFVRLVFPLISSRKLTN